MTTLATCKIPKLFSLLFDLDVSDTQTGENFAKNSACTAVFMQHRVQKPYKAKCKALIL